MHSEEEHLFVEKPLRWKNLQNWQIFFMIADKIILKEFTKLLFTKM